MEKFIFIAVYETTDIERLQRALNFYLDPEAGKRITGINIDQVSLESNPFLVDDVLIEAMKILIQQLKAWLESQENIKTDPPLAPPAAWK